MTLLGQTLLGLATALMTVLLCLSSTGEGYKQEMWLYEDLEEGNIALYFDTHVPDLTEYSATLSKIETVCTTGWWLLSNAVNYQGYSILAGSGANYTYCIDYNMTTEKSLRHFAANDTAIDAISLYSGDYFFGDEIFVTTAKTNISIIIRSLAASGTSNWMLFEGKTFDGKSVCYQVPYSDNEFNWDWDIANNLNLNMTTVGSVFKGCDLDEIQLYRESHLL